MKPETYHKGETFIAKTISFIFHPLLIPTYTILILFNLKYFFLSIIPLKAKLILLGNVIGFTFLIPAVIIFLLLRFSVIRSYQMEIRNERALPLLITAIFYYMTYYLFKNVSLPPLIYNYFLMSTTLIIIALLINMFWKISLHTIAMGALMGLLLVLYIRLSLDTRIWLVASIFTSGLTGTARLLVSDHTQAQVYTGYLLGFSVMFGFYYFL
jgi:hypothetical protein